MGRIIDISLVMIPTSHERLYSIGDCIDPPYEKLPLPRERVDSPQAKTGEG
ncbi:MAG: hypothetical protein GF315_12095 [candidate division Zixibacteria bacterium]|nr:hypothetical protein [candidate division Zixibacteria bacterium]